MGKTHIIAKFHGTDLVICSHSRERNTPSYSRRNRYKRQTWGPSMCNYEYVPLSLLGNIVMRGKQYQINITQVYRCTGCNGVPQSGYFINFSVLIFKPSSTFTF